MEYEKFVTKLIKHKSGSHYVLVPSNIIKFAGWIAGDEIVIMGTKRVKGDVKNEQEGTA